MLSRLGNAFLFDFSCQVLSILRNLAPEPWKIQNRSYAAAMRANLFSNHRFKHQFGCWQCPDDPSDT